MGRVRISELQNRVTVQEVSRVSDGMGGFSDTWAATTEPGTVWAAVKPLRGREYFEARQVIGEVSHRILIRYQDGVTVKNRILWGSRVFNISSVINWQEKNEWLEIICDEEII